MGIYYIQTTLEKYTRSYVVQTTHFKENLGELADLCFLVGYLSSLNLENFCLKMSSA